MLLATIEPETFGKFTRSELGAASAYVAIKVIQQNKSSDDIKAEPIKMTQEVFKSLLKDLAIVRPEKVLECARELTKVLRREGGSALRELLVS